MGILLRVGVFAEYSRLTSAPRDEHDAISSRLVSKGVDMDFIERIFGFSPDGGSGAFEVLLFLIPLAGILILHRRRKRAGQREAPRK
jgi:hypothetical protein